MHLMRNFAPVLPNREEFYGKKVRFPRRRLGHSRNEFRAESGAQGKRGPHLQGRHGRGQHVFRTGRYRVGDQSGSGQLREAHRRHHDCGRLDQRPRRRGESSAQRSGTNPGTHPVGRELRQEGRRHLRPAPRRRTLAAPSTCTAKADTRNSASCTIRTTQARKSRPASSKP